MYKIITKEKITHYINEQFRLNENNLFDIRAEEDRRVVNYRIASIFDHFLDTTTGAQKGLVLQNPYGTHHRVKLAEYSEFDKINNIDELIEALRKYQLIICEVMEDLQLDERTRLLDTYHALENDNEIER